MALLISPLFIPIPCATMAAAGSVAAAGTSAAILIAGKKAMENEQHLQP